MEIDVYNQFNFSPKGLKIIAFWAAHTYKTYIRSTTSHAWSKKKKIRIVYNLFR